jgi:hypothetical protein
MLVMLVLSALFNLNPFIPGVRDIPRAIPLYKQIWREHYRELREVAGAGTDTPDS